MSERILETMTASGWYTGRRMAVGAQVQALASAGYVVDDAVRAFLAEFSLLEIRSRDAVSGLWVDAERAVAETDPVWVQAYELSAGTALRPIGGYSHMSVFLGLDKVFYGGFDLEFGELGASWKDVVYDVLVRRPPLSLSRLEP